MADLSERLSTTTIEEVKERAHLIAKTQRNETLTRRPPKTGPTLYAMAYRRNSMETCQVLLSREEESARIVRTT